MHNATFTVGAFEWWMTKKRTKQITNQKTLKSSRRDSEIEAELTRGHADGT